MRNVRGGTPWSGIGLGTEFRSEKFRGIDSELFPLFRGRIFIYFGSTERNSELFSLPQKGSEHNYGSLLLFLFHGTEFRIVFSSEEGFGTAFRDFLFRGTTGIPSEITICSVYSVFRGIIFLSEIPNPNLEAGSNLSLSMPPAKTPFAALCASMCHANPFSIAYDKHKQT